MRSVVDERGGDGCEGGRCGGRSPSFPYCALSYPSAGVRIQPSAQSASAGTQFARTKRWWRVLLSSPSVWFVRSLQHRAQHRDPFPTSAGRGGPVAYIRHAHSAPSPPPTPPRGVRVVATRRGVTLTCDHPAIIRARCVDPLCHEAAATDRISGHRPSSTRLRSTTFYQSARVVGTTVVRNNSPFLLLFLLFLSFLINLIKSATSLLLLFEDSRRK